MPLSAEELRARIATQQWTSHNIRLDAECTTMPGEPDFITTDLRRHAILRVLNMLFGENPGGVRVADLGCLEGGFSLALAQRGAEVPGIEARRRNVEKAALLRDHFGLSNLRFHVGDVKDFGSDGAGQFDVVLALGILYHLDEPARWLRQVARATRRVLILDTHFAPADDAAMSLLDPRLSLGPIETQDVNGAIVKGRWFREFADDADREAQLRASYSNSSSFWLTKESLVRSTWQSSYKHCMLVAIKS